VRKFFGQGSGEVFSILCVRTLWTDPNLRPFFIHRAVIAIAKRIRAKLNIPNNVENSEEEIEKVGRCTIDKRYRL